ncbi:MAG: type II toxin-antitoxin system Phd/YefM family antitoxin [Plectolyngbya sp. WJT66-NPBG17]|jgi:PHD/YefM family antitoxin component YafN of YafNO toxin-antitoxin module|nr:type II toxin-antitoxin system Phd/YefM family antitoxin [Plectolyngbya sp. WJT66-NPBG17]MBW4526445.1 type II toxin-antitoxin system Phd/YefM family antitoxin [Phormidium tanganyikae FI6-MK23]
MPKRLTIAEAQQQLPNLPNELTDEPIIITQDGLPVMAAMSYEQLTSLLETLDILSDQEFASKLRQSILQAEQGERISWDEVQKRLEL